MKKPWYVRYEKITTKGVVTRFFKSEAQARRFYLRMSRHQWLMTASIGHVVNAAAARILLYAMNPVLKEKSLAKAWEKVGGRTRTRIRAEQERTVRALVEEILVTCRPGAKS